MPTIRRRNAVLRSLTPDQRRVLQPIDLVELQAGQVLYRPGDPITDLYFMETGLSMTLRSASGGHAVPIWFYGSNGRAFVGSHGVFDPHIQIVYEYRVILPGTAWRVSCDTMRTAMVRNEGLRTLIRNIMRVINVAMVQSVACRTVHSLEQRLAMTLLNLRYVLDSDTLPLNRAMVAELLLTQRQVTYKTARHWGDIVTWSPTVQIHDAAALERRACGCLREIMRARDSRFRRTRVAL